MNETRFVLYAHDGLGLGHTKRSLAIARALAAQEQGAAILLATGSEALDLFELPPGVDVLKLPSVRKVANGDYVSRRLALSRTEIAGLRSSVLEAAVAAFEPDVILADKHPAGVAGELVAALELNRKRGGSAALGLRDIMDSPDAVKQEWEREGVWRTVERYYDRVLIYGQQDVVDQAAAYGIPAPMARRLTYCGYVTDASVSPCRRERLCAPAHAPFVLATAGGGEDGSALFETFLAAAMGSGWDAHLVAGPMAGEGVQGLRERCEAAGVTFHIAMPAMAEAIARADAVVCMGGYNTLLEVVAAGTPAVCLPRRHPRQEQAIRAGAFERMGLLTSLEDADGAALRAAVEGAIGQERDVLWARARTRLELNGASKAASALHRLAGRRYRGGLMAAGGM